MPNPFVVLTPKLFSTHPEQDSPTELNPSPDRGNDPAPGLPSAIDYEEGLQTPCK